MFSFFFTNDRVKDYDAVAKSNIEFFNAFFHEMLSHGIYLGPSAFEAGFLSAKHGDTEIDRTIQAADAAFATLRAPRVSIQEQNKRSFEMFELIGIGNAIVDTDVEIDEVFLENESLPKGQMTLIDSDRMAELVGA